MRSSSLPGCLTERATPLTVIPRPSILLDLAPGGVCLASAVTNAAGGLLHRRFTLTNTVPQKHPVQCRGLLSVALCRQVAYVENAATLSDTPAPKYAPAWPLASTVLYRVRTFLKRHATPHTARGCLADSDAVTCSISQRKAGVKRNFDEKDSQNSRGTQCVMERFCPDSGCGGDQKSP